MARPLEGTPISEAELRLRAASLEGRTLDEVARSLGVSLEGDAVRTKGKVGALVERALGATGGSTATHDFPHLAIELKTIPIDARGVPRESTYVCTVSLADAEREEWSTSWTRAKLAHVLWVPVRVPVRVPEDPESQPRRFGAPVFWRPTPAQEQVLRGDYEDAMGAIAIGGIEGLTAHAGRWLQVRPKARDGSARTLARGRENEAIATVPRGFYLRARFTAAILHDPAALP
jgi:DNA mismatch repair protein MutH